MSWRKPKLRIGLDIGGHSVKLVAINSRDNSVYACQRSELVSAEMARTPSEVSDVHLRMALRKVFQDLPNKRSAVQLAISTPFNNVFVLSMPDVDDSEIKQALFWELGPLLPKPAAQYEFDYRLLRREKKKHRLVVLVGTILRTQFEMIVPVLKGLVSEIPLLDLESLALLERFRQDYPELTEPVGLLHMGATHSSYTIVAPEADPVFLSLPFGGDILDGVISRNRGVPVLTAEWQRKEAAFAEKIISQSADGDKEDRETWEIFVQFVSTILRFNTRYEVQNQKKVTRVVATGGLCNDHLIQHILNTPDLFLKIPAEYWEPLKGLMPDEQIDAGLGFQYGIALEMALRNG